MRDVFELEPTTQILTGNSYLLSYPHLLSYFASRDIFDASDLVRGAHMVYGWMPTILNLAKSPNPDFNIGAEILNRARRDGRLSKDAIKSLVKLINNSLVGTSKLLHFVAPNKFAIWDSKVYTFVYEERPHHHQLNQVDRYCKYLRKLKKLCRDPRFKSFHESVNRKVGYDVSPMRAIELVMFNAIL